MLTVSECRDLIQNFAFLSNRTAELPGTVGLEVEMIPLRRVGHSAERISLPLHVGDITLASILIDFAKAKGCKTFFEGNLLAKIELEEGDYLTFEPGGQLELSTTPYPCLREAIARLEGVQKDLDAVFAKFGVKLFQAGMNPVHSVKTIGLQMTKPRYLAMNQFFIEHSPSGQEMMRKTASVQICLDFGVDEEMLAKRYLVAQMLAPVASALFAFSPFSDGQATPYKSFRSHIWRRMDPTRSGFCGIQGISEAVKKNKNQRQACVDSYLEKALSCKVVHLPSYDVPSSGLTFREWLLLGYKGIFPTMADFQTHLSLLFPEVRPKGFLEIRSIDCQARTWQAVPGAFCAGLLYDESSLEGALSLLLPRLNIMEELLRESVYGLKHPTLRSLAKDLMSLSLSGFDRLPQCYSSDSIKMNFGRFAERLTFQERTPADDWVDLMQKSNSGDHFSAYEKLEDSWK